MARKTPKPLHGREQPLADPRPVVVGGRVVAVVQWCGTDYRITEEVGLAFLTAAQCMEAAVSVQRIVPGLTHEECYRWLVGAGMPDGGWEAW